MDRREFFRLSGRAAAGMILSGLSLNGLDLPFSGERTLSFYQTHTCETLDACYWNDGDYVPHSLQQIDLILRDHRTGEVKPIEKKLLDMLFVLQKNLKTDKNIHIISGYRSPQTNQKLRKKSLGVAKKSLHMSGKAVDIRIPGIPLQKLRRAAMDLKAGGVGYYPGSDFIHIDTGRVRCW
ncbi:MAG: DUF882 domain-containing protein [Acidobacteria bacterium]|nr:DUF882 domain-containing protein [Acidobacteriota bacterium]